MTKVRKEKIQLSLMKIAELRYYFECLRINKKEYKALEELGNKLRAELENNPVKKKKRSSSKKKEEGVK